MIDLGFFNESGMKVGAAGFKVLLKKAEKVLAARIKKLLNAQKGDISLIITDDAGICLLNTIHRKKNKPTDVLSFAYLENKNFKNGSAVISIGDIFISHETALKQAKEHKHPLKKELEILFVHGLLHLLGFDHQNDKQEDEMEKFARKILS
ncbi:MAG: rRNA maturation RNase YbeY [Candidatus Gracilibacteria bacterium]|jgi:probable rRNA maturation factor